MKLTSKNRKKRLLEGKDKEYDKNYSSQYRISNKKYLNDLSKSWGTSKKGVYAIFENGKCLHVGESSWLKQRISSHKTYTKNPKSSPKSQRGLYEILNKNHPLFVIGILEQTDNHKEREQFYINNLKPLYNGK